MIEPKKLLRYWPYHQLKLFRCGPVLEYENKKSELLLMRRARAYGSSGCSQLIGLSIYLHPFCCTSLFCSPKSHKITKILYFPGSRSCKVIDADIINTINKHVTIACYDNIAKFRQKIRSFNDILRYLRLPLR